jgi:hypothetical protein
MGLNNIGEWLEQLERRKQLQQEVMDGEFIELRKANGFAYPRIIGTVADVSKERREAEYRKILEKIRRDAVDVEVAKSIAIAKTLPLKKTPKIEVVKQNNVEKPLVSELPLIALHGGDVHKLMSWRVLRGMIENAER